MGRNAAEKTLVILKPDCVSRGLVGEVLARFERKGLKLVGMNLQVIPRETIEQHYSEHAERPFFGELCGFMTSGPVLLMAVEGPQAISVTRKLVGSTAGYEAEPGTVRGDFGVSKQANLIHASDSAESAARELELFFGGSAFVSYETPRETWW